MAIRSIRILVELTFPARTIRLWDGAGPFVDTDGEIWAGVSLLEGLDRVESALNGEASTLELALSGVDPRISAATEELDETIGATVRIGIQPCDAFDQPVGGMEVRFTGTIDNMRVDDVVSEEQVVSRVTVEIVNRFDLRNLASGEVLSDVNQHARAAVLNPLGTPDRFAERIAGMADRVIWWPRFT